jgi:hypothetical protein
MQVTAAAVASSHWEQEVQQWKSTEPEKQVPEVISYIFFESIFLIKVSCKSFFFFFPTFLL